MVFVCHEPIREMDAIVSAPKSFDFRLQAQRALVIARLVNAFREYADIDAHVLSQYQLKVD